MKFGTLNFLEHSGPLHACNGTAFLKKMREQIFWMVIQSRILNVFIMNRTVVFFIPGWYVIKHKEFEVFNSVGSS